MKRFFVFIAVIAAAVALTGCSLIVARYKKNPPLPQVEGEIKIKGLHGPVSVIRDPHGVPHIMAEDEHDLFFAIGFVQAQDRLFEIYLLRAVAQGRISEIVGDIGAGSGDIMGFPLSTYGIDLRQRLMGMRWLGEVGERLLKETDPAVFAQLQAYCDGVNAIIDSQEKTKDRPLEFQVLSLKPEPLRVADVISLGRFIGSMLCGNLEQELSRHALIKKFGPEIGWTFMPLHHAQGPTIVPKEMLKNRLETPRDLPPGGRPSDAELGTAQTALDPEDALALMAAEYSVRRALYVKAPHASNNWIVSPKITETGTAMLANDPHLEHIEPSLFYMMHVKGGGIDAFGVTFPGNPYTVLGHTRKLAWGATTTAADVQDAFIETTDKDHPGKYLYKGKWRPFVERTEIIKTRVGSAWVDKKLKVRQSIHGPIINDMAGLGKDAPPVAMRWTGWDFSRDLRAFEAIITSATADEAAGKILALPDIQENSRNEAIMCNILMRGQSIEDFKKGMEMIVVPNQSWVAADADGHIAYLPGGFVPMRKRGIGVLPVPGESGEFDWSGFIPLMEHPYAIDPERGWMATANNEVVDAEWYPHVFSTDYGDGWRASRIEELIKELQPISIADMVRIQNDVQVKKAKWMTPIILKAVETKKSTDPRVLEAADELRNWNFEADLDNTACVIFFRFFSDLTRNTVEDELPKKDAARFLGGQGQNVENWVVAGKSPFFDDKRTDPVEDMDDMIVKSLADAMDWIHKNIGPNKEDRRWGKLHYIKWYNPVGIGPLSDLSVGPFEHIGAANTVRNASWGGFGRDPYKALGGPVLRHIMDMGDPDHALMIIDGSQSGQWLSPHYRDLHPYFVNGKYITAVMDPGLIQLEAEHTLILTPEK